MFPVDTVDETFADVLMGMRNPKVPLPILISMVASTGSVTLPSISPFTTFTETLPRISSKVTLPFRLFTVTFMFFGKVIM